jgi:hypothetical protein
MFLSTSPRVYPTLVPPVRHSRLNFRKHAVTRHPGHCACHDVAPPPDHHNRSAELHVLDNAEKPAPHQAFTPNSTAQSSVVASHMPHANP